MVKTLLIGYLGNDATQNNFNGKSVINFNVAHTDKWKDQQGNNMEKTLWVACSWWIDRTGILPFLKKGTQVYVEGTPDVKSYQRQDGSTGVSFVLKVQSVQLLGGKNTQSESELSGPGQQSGGSGEEPVDDLPF